MGLIGALGRAYSFGRMSREEQDRFQQEKLKEIVKFAKENCPAYRELYKDIDVNNFRLEDLPAVTKPYIMEHYDDFLSDRRVKKAELDAFTENSVNVGKEYLGKYLISKTSGSTGYPFTYLMDKNFKDESTAEVIRAGLASKFPVVYLYSTTTYSISGAMVKDTKSIKSMHLIDMSEPIAAIVEKLNKIKPKMVFSYTSAVDILASEQENGRLSISPKLIVCISEMLNENEREYFTKVFSCPVRSVYGMTEMYFLAYECDEPKMHIENPYAIVEPVDEENRRVKDGEVSDKILLTNLSNKILPLIRYEIGDRVIYHNGGCACGSKRPYVELSGRSFSNLVEFEGDVKPSVIMIHTYMEVVKDVLSFQLIFHGKHRLEFRIHSAPGSDTQKQFEEGRDKIKHYLEENGIYDMEYYLSSTPPTPDEKTHKIRYIYQVFDDEN